MGCTNLRPKLRRHCLALFLLRATAATIAAPTTVARAAPKFPSPPFGVNLAFFRPRKSLRADDPPTVLRNFRNLISLPKKLRL